MEVHREKNFNSNFQIIKCLQSIDSQVLTRATASKAPKQRLNDTAARSLKSLNATPGQILVRSMADIEAVTLCDRER